MVKKQASEKPMKVYGWQSFRPGECPPAASGSTQTREIIAAPSMAAAARIARVKRPDQLFNLCETGNDEEIAVAMAEPGVVFWKPINDWKGEYRRAEPAAEKEAP